jgi:hypothetical protein
VRTRKSVGYGGRLSVCHHNERSVLCVSAIQHYNADLGAGAAMPGLKWSEMAPGHLYSKDFATAIRFVTRKEVNKMKVAENIRARIVLINGFVQLAAKAFGLLTKAVSDGDISIGEAVELVKGVSDDFLARKQS